MKTETSKRYRTIHRHIAGPALCAFLCGPLALSGLSQEAKPAAAQAVNAPAANTSVKDSTTDKKANAGTTSATATAYPPVGVAEVLKMIDAGVSPEIIRTYLENSTAAYDPNAADLITLKTNGVPDSVTAALMKRVAEIKALNQKKKADQAAVERNAGPAPLDPESYDFWWSQHGYPRVLSSTYRQLDPYQGGGFYTFGRSYYPPATYYPMRDPRYRSFGPGRHSPYWSR